MKFINFIIIRFAGCFASGIIAAYYFPVPFSFVLKVLCLQCLVLVALWVWEHNKLQPGIAFGIITYTTFFTLGYTKFQAEQPQQQRQHVSHFLKENTSEVLQIKITQILKPNQYHQKYFASVLQIKEQTTRGKVLLSIQKGTMSPAYQVDQILWVAGKIEALQEPLNPYQFNYKDYLQHQGVYQQLRISKRDIYVEKEGDPTLRGLAEKFRNHLIQKLSETPIEFEQRSIMQALLLGERSSIDKDLYAQYAAAGALHILAVSGLHVGILFLIFSRLLTPLEYFKYGKNIKIVILVVFLWGFALLAGLSPSVVRAVTMFSFFALAGLLKRPTHSFNTLFLSFFVLLIIHPNWLFHVGFQLSYLAVFFILWLQPKLFALYAPKYVLDKQIWGIITVTLAAQIGIAPLSVYYFHQFPGLFFVSNLVILPFLGLLLTGGLMVLLLSIFNILPHWLAESYNGLIHQLNSFIRWVARQEAFLFEDISFSIGVLLIIYVFILSLLSFFMQTTAKRMLRLQLSLLLLLSVSLWEKYSQKEEELVLFHKTGSTLLGHRRGDNLTVYCNDSLTDMGSYPLKSYRLNSGSNCIDLEYLPTVFNYQGQYIMQLDSLAIYPSEEIDILLLTQSPKIHLERIIDRLKPRKIIADGSNFPWFADRWRKTCERRNVDFYDTRSEGAYTFNNHPR